MEGCYLAVKDLVFVYGINKEYNLDPACYRYALLQ